MVTREMGLGSDSVHRQGAAVIGREMAQRGLCSWSEQCQRWASTEAGWVDGGLLLPVSRSESSSQASGVLRLFLGAVEDPFPVGHPLPWKRGQGQAQPGACACAWQ